MEKKRVTIGTFHSTSQMTSEVLSTLESGRISYGPKSAWFERAFADSHHCRHGVVSNSGTSSLLVALQALKELRGWPDSGKIIVPAVTFVASVNAIRMAGYTPTLVDVSKTLDYTIDTELIEYLVTDDTVAIMPVHLFGSPCYMDGIMSIAKRHDLAVIEDCCEAFGARYNGKPVGSIGDIGCFSTYVGHHIVTGAGGMSLTDDDELSSVMRSLVNHGISLDNLPVGDEYDPGHLGREFVFHRIGHSFRITEIEAAIGLSQIRNWVQKVTKRKINAVTYRNLLDSVDEISAIYSYIPPYETSPMVMPIVIRDGTPASHLMAYLRQHGIECRSMMPLTNQPCYDFDEDLYPVAKHVNKYGFYVGCHEDMGEEEVRYACSWIKEYFSKSDQYFQE